MTDKELRENIKTNLYNRGAVGLVMRHSLACVPQEICDWIKENIDFTVAVGKAEFIAKDRLTKPYLVILNDGWILEPSFDKKCWTIIHESAHCKLGHVPTLDKEDTFKKEKEAEALATQWVGFKRTELMNRFCEEKGFI